MHLEVISRYSASPSEYAPVLFVHGGFHAAWCWNEFFLGHFSDHGFDAHALSLRGHGDSEGHNKLQCWGLSDYCDDLAQVAATIDRTPILIGHSIGAVIVQRYVQMHPASAIVMIAPTPLASMPLRKLLWACRFPVSTAKMVVLRDVNYMLPALRHLFFPADSDEQQVQRYMARMQKESNRVFQDIGKIRDPNPKGVQLPVLILAAENDQIPARINERLATSYAAELETLPISHDAMLTPQWRMVADRIIHWIANSTANSRRTKP